MHPTIKAEQRGKNVGTKRGRPTRGQIDWLRQGLQQPGGKLPLFDHLGQKVSDRTVKSCIQQGWAEPWFDNPIKPDWLICKLTDTGRELLEKAD
ncbi:MAG: hypothetical protein CMM76_14830 [Rhodospirillaceae bacterium]|nr:hypothetical protein [Rhodospirillaceae bacterium]|tara:strand:+ start:276 stop:557 length:282 start_codon:yes stop_codon:yes gene_type:complete